MRARLRTSSKPTIEATNPNPAATANVVGSQIRVQNIDSVKTNQSVTLRVTATPAALAAGTCTSNPFTWTAKAYAGNSLNGDQFSNAGQAPQTTTLLGCITLQFVSGFAPTDGVVDTGMHVKVEAIAGGSPLTSFAGVVTIEKVSGPGNLS